MDYICTYIKVEWQKSTRIRVTSWQQWWTYYILRMKYKAQFHEHFPKKWHHFVNVKQIDKVIFLPSFGSLQFKKLHIAQRKRKPENLWRENASQICKYKILLKSIPDSWKSAALHFVLVREHQTRIVERVLKAALSSIYKPLSYIN